MNKPQIIDAEPEGAEPQNNLVPIAGAAAAITPMDMLDRAVASGASAETLATLLALQERWDKNQARKAFDDAMSSAKAEIPVIHKNREVDFTSPKGRTNYRHEDLAGIARIVDPILSRHGLSYRFRTSSPPSEPVSVTCIVSHRLGHSEENSLSAGRDESGNKNSIQAIGSTITYLQRYTLKAALGLSASSDDDGKSSATADMGVITDAQVAELQTAVVAAGADIARFLDAFNVESLTELPAKRFGEAKTRLERYARTARARQEAQS